MGDLPVLGIDLGTTYSCAARLDEYGRPQVLANLDGEFTTPSVVYFEPNASVVVGEAAKNELRREPDRVVELIKRHMGEEDYDVEIDGESYLPQRISAIILRSVAEGALLAAGEDPPAGDPIADVVITVPAYFGAAERQATVDAGRLAGLNVVNIINEPTAAALAYRPPEQSGPVNILVYDLGGGTFDVTVIRQGPEEVRVIATDGDHQLGGANWDEVLQDMLAEQYLAEHPERGDPRGDDVAAGELLLLAEAAKRSLSTKELYRSSVTAHGERAAVQVSRQDYEQRTAFLLERTLDFTRRILKKAADKGVQEYDAVLLVGGMSRSPAVARSLAETFPSLPAARLSDPDQIVAKGAALFAARSVLETGAQDGETGEAAPGLPGVAARIVNVSSKGYGIRAVRGPQDEQGYVAWLIRPNDPLPCAPRQTFRTVHHDQSEVAVRIFESPTTELDASVEVNRELIAGVLEGLPPGRPPGEPVQVDFVLGDDGILRILAHGDNGVELRLEARISAATPEQEFQRPLPDIQY